MLLLSTSSLEGYGLHRIFSIAKDAGYDGIDLQMNPKIYDVWDATYVKELSMLTGVPVLSLTAPDKGMNQDKVDAIFQMAELLGSQILTFSPPHITDRHPEWFLQFLPKAKKDTGLSVCVQNVPPKFKFFIIPEYKNATLAEIKKLTGDTTLDVASVDSSTGTDILKAEKVLGNSIKNIFLSDKQGRKNDLLPGNAGGGMSHLPLESFLMKLKKSGYRGCISLKVLPEELGVGSIAEVTQRLQSLHEYYKKYFLEFK